MPPSKTKGFTLIEMAIVLVVVGLLMGGVLRGQEMISAAKARHIIDQKSSIRTAIVAFANRYNATAGDLTSAQANFIGGGVAASSSAGSGSIMLAGSTGDASVLVFQNLVATGFLICATCTANGNGIASNQNSPLNAQSAYLQYGKTAPSAAGIYWLDLSASPARNILTTGAQISAATLQQVDIKADDGLPSTGLFRQSTTGGADGVATCTAAKTLSSGTTLAAWVTTDTVNCAGAWLF